MKAAAIADFSFFLEDTPSTTPPHTEHENLSRMG